VQRQRQRRLDAAERQALEDAASPTVEQHELLVADAAAGAEQLDRLEHGVEVVRRLAHAHEDDLRHRRAGARERDLRDDLGAAELALEAARPSCRTRSRPRSRPGSTRTGRRAAAARPRPSGRRRGRPGGAREPSALGVIAAQHRQRAQIGLERGQRVAQRERQEVFGPLPSARLRLGARPLAQHALLVDRPCAGGAQAPAKRFDVHGGETALRFARGLRRERSSRPR
jgi:hypothetical protein